MMNLRLLAALPFVFAIVAPACSAPDPGGPARAYNAGRSSGSGNGSGGAGGGSGGGSSGPTGGGVAGGGGGGASNDYDASPVPGATDYDSGAPATRNDGGGGGTGTGGGKDAGSGNSGTLGSCGNPICGTDLNQCGCRATDSANNTIEIGCQAGGQCGCFQNGNFVNGTASAENDACQSNADVKDRFLSDCTCN